VSRLFGWRPFLPLLLATACASPPPDIAATPEHVALGLFALAQHNGEPSAETLATLVVANGDAISMARLRDAIAGLKQTSPPEVTRVLVLAEGVRALDLEIALKGGGVAHYSLQCEETPTGWRITSFQGPDLGWPTRAAGGDGLSTSAPPSPGADRVSPRAAQ
jgi:hypothetical protein